MDNDLLDFDTKPEASYFEICPKWEDVGFSDNTFYFMKTLHLILLFCLLRLTTLFAEESNSFPDFSKAFPTEKLFIQMKLGEIENYAYATDSDFAKLKRAFIDFLGQDWAEEKVDPEIEALMNEGVKDQDMVIEDTVLFSNAEFPGVLVSLSQMRMELEGKQFLVSITVFRNMSEFAGTGPFATRTGMNSEGSGTPQPKMNWLSVITGVCSAWYGFYTLLLRKRAPEKFGKLNVMKRMWGAKAGYTVHFAAYSVIPIILGVILFFAGVNGASL